MICVGSGNAAYKCVLIISFIKHSIFKLMLHSYIYLLNLIVYVMIHTKCFPIYKMKYIFNVKQNDSTYFMA